MTKRITLSVRVGDVYRLRTEQGLTRVRVEAIRQGEVGGQTSRYVCRRLDTGAEVVVNRAKRFLPDKGASRG